MIGATKYESGREVEYAIKLKHHDLATVAMAYAEKAEQQLQGFERIDALLDIAIEKRKFLRLAGIVV